MAETKDIPFDRNSRRRKILIRNTFLVMVAYFITQAVSLIAKFLGLSSIEYGQIATVFFTTVGVTALFIIAAMLKKKMSITYTNIFFFSQFAVWLIMYTYWVFTLHEMRFVALFFALMALTFLLANSNFLQSLSIVIGATVIQLTVSYFAIIHRNQSGSLKAEIFFTFCFLPSAVFIAFLSEGYFRQRNEIKKAKRQAEEARDALWGEMALAKKIQTVLLPEKPSIRGFETAMYMAPAEQIGGDYYDVINEKAADWIIIGDVSGHGLPSGLVMMMVQSMIHTIVGGIPGISPSLLMNMVNRAITYNIKKLGEDKYMTLLAMSVDDSGRCTYSGMHLPIFIYRARTDTVEVVGQNGMWVGILDDTEQFNCNMHFETGEGDAVLLYSDGITEAVAKDGTLYETDRLIAAFRVTAKKSPEEIQREILNSLAGYEIRDDVTLMVLKRTRGLRS